MTLFVYEVYVDGMKSIISVNTVEVFFQPLCLLVEINNFIVSGLFLNHLYFPKTLLHSLQFVFQQNFLNKRKSTWF